MSGLTEEAVETADLDMLDGLRHAACFRCYPGDMAFGQRFVAMCEREALASGQNDPGWVVPPNACSDCERLRYDSPCPRCGR
jgi:hypothetical protein